MRSTKPIGTLGAIACAAMFMSAAAADAQPHAAAAGRGDRRGPVHLPDHPGRPEQQRLDRRRPAGSLDLAPQSVHQDLDDGRLAPYLGFFLVRELLAIRLAPVSGAIGEWGDDTYYDVGAAASLDLSLGAFEVSLAAPRYSYVHHGADEWSDLPLRFTWRIDP